MHVEQLSITPRWEGPASVDTSEMFLFVSPMMLARKQCALKVYSNKMLPHWVSRPFSNTETAVDTFSEWNFELLPGEMRMPLFFWCGCSLPCFVRVIRQKLDGMDKFLNGKNITTFQDLAFGVGIRFIRLVIPGKKWKLAKPTDFTWNCYFSAFLHNEQQSCSLLTPMVVFKMIPTEII